MSADTLSVPSRKFYERVKMKVMLSIYVSGAALMMLGFCSLSAGLSSANDTLKDNVDDNTLEDAYGALSAGYGIIYVNLTLFLL